MSRGLLILVALVLLAAVGANLHYTLIALDNQGLIHDRAAPDNIHHSSHIIEKHHYYVPSHEKNESLVQCGDPHFEPVFRNDTHQRGERIYFGAYYEGCLLSWTFSLPEFNVPPQEGGGENWVWFDRSGSHRVYFYAEFEDGSVIEFDHYIFVGPPRAAVPDPPADRVVYHEEPLAPNVTLSAFVSNARQWRDRGEVGFAQWALWWNGLAEHPGYAQGVDGVTVNAVPFSPDYGILTQGKMWAFISDQSDPGIGSCRGNYGPMEMVPIDYFSALAQGFAWVSRPVGCNLAEFTPGETLVQIFYEVDGELLPPGTPWFGPEGEGFLYDEPDATLEFLV